MLSIRNLSFAYDTTPVLKGIDLVLPQGSNCSIIGPNGCGKTTLLKCIAGLLSYEGSIGITAATATREVHTLSPKQLATTVGLMAQSAKVYFPYSVWDTVSLGRYAHTTGVFHRLSAQDHQRIQDVLEQVGLLAFRDKPISELSGGQLQRVFLARLLAQDPSILLLDEPTNHLDLKYQIELLGFIKTWAKEENKTVVGVLHDLNLVQAFSDYVILLNEGGIYAQGKTKEVLTKENLLHCYGLDIPGWMTTTLRKWEV